MEVVTAIFALASLSSLLVAVHVSVICTSFSASELWQFMLSVSAAPAILIGLIIAARMRQTLTGLKITHEELVSLAMIDGLTGLLNRPGFDAVAAEAFEKTRRLGQPVSALVCDIDAFRRLNDRYGYDAGDRALRNLTEVLEEVIGRRSVILGRRGGDEFVILLPGIDLKEAVSISEDVCEACEARALVQQEPAAKFTISVGVGTGLWAHPSLKDFFVKRKPRCIGPRARVETSRVGVGGFGSLSVSAGHQTGPDAVGQTVGSGEIISIHRELCRGDNRRS